MNLMGLILAQTHKRWLLSIFIYFPVQLFVCSDVKLQLFISLRRRCYIPASYSCFLSLNSFSFEHFLSHKSLIIEVNRKVLLRKTLQMFHFEQQMKMCPPGSDI